MTQPSKAEIKIYQALKSAHGRKKHQQFIVEGAKMVEEALLAKMSIAWLAAVPTWIETHTRLLGNIKTYTLSTQALQHLSLMQHPQQVLAVLNKAPVSKFSKADDEWVLVLDGLQDPGNIGTIVRTAEWFGIKQILCSPNTVDIYNPKAVQASMGSIFRMAVHYQEVLPILTAAQRNKVPIYASLLQGNNLFTHPLAPHGYLIIGNEGHGISKELLSLQPSALYIPAAQDAQAESLNAAIASGIFLAQITASKS